MNREIRIFLSSTFIDLQDERNYLVKVAIPMLKRYCKERYVSLSVVDLRWGVTDEDARSGKIVELCMDEIRRTRPFFVGIVSGRYGWQPPASFLESNKRLSNRYPWIADCMRERMSITEMEIQYGVLRNDNPVNAFFFLGEGQPQWREEKGSEREVRLTRLKQNIRTAAAEGRCTADDFHSPQELGETFFRRLKAMVDSLFPAEETGSSLVRLMHHQENEWERLRRVYMGDTNPALSLSWNDFGNLSKHPHHIGLVITGPSGSGKSAFLANWDIRDVLRFPEAPEGVEVAVLRTRVEGGCNEMDTLMELFHQQAKRRDIDTETQPVLWILDGIDRINNGSESIVYEGDLEKLPEKTLVIVSTSNSKEAALIADRDNCPIYDIQPLDDTAVSELIRRYLKEVGKQLPGHLLEKIFKSPLLHNPICLKVFLSELIQYGIHETLDQCIGHYMKARSSAELMDLVYQRIEEDFGKDDVRRVLQTMLLCDDGASASMLSPKMDFIQWTAITGALEEVVRASGDFVVLQEKTAREAAEARYFSGNGVRGQEENALLKRLRLLARHAPRHTDEREHYVQEVLRILFRQGKKVRACIWMEWHLLDSVSDSTLIKSISMYVATKPWLLNPLVLPRFFFLFGISDEIRIIRRMRRNYIKKKPVTNVSEWTAQVWNTLTLFNLEKVSQNRENFEKELAVMESSSKKERFQTTLHKYYLRLGIIGALQREDRWAEADELIEQSIQRGGNNPIIQFFFFTKGLHFSDLAACQRSLEDYEIITKDLMGWFEVPAFERGSIIHVMKVVMLTAMALLRNDTPASQLLAPLLDIAEADLGTAISAGNWLTIYCKDPKGNERADKQASAHWLSAKIYEYAADHSQDVKDKVLYYGNAAYDYKEAEFFDDSLRCYRLKEKICLESYQDPDEILAVKSKIEILLRNVNQSWEQALSITMEMWPWYDQLEPGDNKLEWEFIICQKIGINCAFLYLDAPESADDALWENAMEHLYRANGVATEKDRMSVSYNLCRMTELLERKYPPRLNPWYDRLTEQWKKYGALTLNIEKLNAAYLLRMLHQNGAALRIVALMDNENVPDSRLPITQPLELAFTLLNEWVGGPLNSPYPPLIPVSALQSFRETIQRNPELLFSYEGTRLHYALMAEVES